VNPQEIAFDNGLAFARERLGAYYELAKPRVLMMVLITAIAGFYLGARVDFEAALALRMLAGVALAAGGTLALNQYFERDTDALMIRTRHRPVPAGRITAIEALVFGLITAVAGIAYLRIAVNPLAAAVTGAMRLLGMATSVPSFIVRVCSAASAMVA